MERTLLTLLVIGVVCVIAGIAGGGLKLFGNEFPRVRSKWRQVLLFIVGLGLILGTLIAERTRLGTSLPAKPPSSTTDTSVKKDPEIKKVE